MIQAFLQLVIKLMTKIQTELKFVTVTTFDGFIFLKWFDIILDLFFYPDKERKVNGVFSEPRSILLSSSLEICWVDLWKLAHKQTDHRWKHKLLDRGEKECCKLETVSRSHTHGYCDVTWHHMDKINCRIHNADCFFVFCFYKLVIKQKNTNLDAFIS